MSRLYEIEGINHHELIFACDGNDGDYLRITWDFDIHENRAMWLELHPPLRLRDRIKSGVKIILGRRPDLGIVLADKSVHELKGFFLNEI